MLRPVVVDLRIRSSLAGLRGLGRAGLRPAAVGGRPSDAGLWSRYAAARVVAPDPAVERERFGSVLARLAPGAGGEVVPYPGQESTIDAIVALAAAHREIRPPFPPAPLQLLRNKAELAARAAERGLRTAPIALRATAAELRRARPPTPCAVKAERPAAALRRTRIAESPEDLAGILEGVPPDEPLLVQPRLRLPLTSVGLVVAPDGRAVARFQHRADWTWPASAGATARAVSVPPDEALIAGATAFLAETGYWGLVELEFLEGPGGPALVDVNPRFYGCLALPLACGVNLPAAWHAVVAGTQAPARREYRVGVTYRWVEADVMAALRGLPERLRRRAPAPRTGPMWAPDDPLPAAPMAVAAVTSRAARELRAARARLAVARRGATEGRSSPGRPS